MIFRSQDSKQLSPWSFSVLPFPPSPSLLSICVICTNAKCEHLANSTKKDLAPKAAHQLHSGLNQSPDMRGRQ